MKSYYLLKWLVGLKLKARCENKVEDSIKRGSLAGEFVYQQIGAGTFEV